MPDVMARLRKHPGRIVRAELEARDLSEDQLALALRVPANRIAAIVRCERSVTPDTAERLGRYLGTGAMFWMNLQTQFDIALAEAAKGATDERDLCRHKATP